MDRLFGVKNILNMKPFVSIIIPCRNEEKFIDKCLDSLIVQDYPKDKLEILVVDGMSEDKTRKIIGDYSQKYFFIKLLDNPKKNTPCALNVGIKKSKGEVIIRMDAHATYKEDYVSKSQKYLKEYKADNIGGTMKTIAQENKIVAIGIVISLSHPFGAGASYFRVGTDKPRLVDTVFGGCYKREVFEKIGFFNENVPRSEDLEFNLRIKKAGGKILLVPDIVSYYYPKTKLKDFFCHNIKDGICTTYFLKFIRMPLYLRHYVPFLFVSGLLGAGFLGIFSPIFFWLFLVIICFYLATALFFAAKIAINKKDIRFLFLMPIVFATRHIGYGLGSIFGLIKIFFPGPAKPKVAKT